MEQMTVGSLFSGIGGIDLGLERAGFKIAWQCEINEYATKVLEKHWPDVTRFRDVRTVGKHNLQPVDLIAGGFPCQPHSIAGERNASKDERDLWPEFYRIICDIRPRWVLAENVPGLLSSENGRFFGGILRDLAQARYDVEWGVLSAAQFGAPHLRERVFIVAHAIDTRQQSTLADSSSVQSQRWGDIGNVGSETPESTSSEKEWQRLWNASPDCGTDVAHTSSVMVPARPNITGSMGKTSTSANSERTAPLCDTIACERPPLADASSQRREECDVTAWHREQGQCTRLVETSRVPGQSQSCMGRIFDGISRGLGEYRWPARPGEQQYEWEAPRVTTSKPAHRIAQLEALGNAVVPQIPEALGRRILSIDNEVVA